MPVAENEANVQNKGISFEPLPNGLYNVQIADVELVKDVVGYEGKLTDKFYFRMGILDPTQRGKLVMHFVSTAYTSGWEKGSPSKLWEFACAVYGQTLNDEDKINVNTLIGGKLQVLVKQKEDKKGKIRSNVVEVMKMEEAGKTLPELTDAEIKKLLPKTTGEASPESMSEEELASMDNAIPTTALPDMQPELNDIAVGEEPKKKAKKVK
jgi:hypothetical protein